MRVCERADLELYGLYFYELSKTKLLMKPFPDEGEYAEIATVGADNPGFDASVSRLYTENSPLLPLRLPTAHRSHSPLLPLRLPTVPTVATHCSGANPR